jgi:hypothetical protein
MIGVKKEENKLILTSIKNFSYRFCLLINKQLRSFIFLSYSINIKWNF